MGYVVVVVREGALRCPVCHLLRLGANRAVAEVVWRAVQDVELLVQNIADAGRAAFEEHVFLGLAVSFELHELVGYGVERLIPGYGNETGVYAAPLFWIGALHGCFDSIWIVHLLNGQVRPWANLPPGCRAIPVACYAEYALVLRIHLHRARGSATLTGGGSPLAKFVLFM